MPKQNKSRGFGLGGTGISLILIVSGCSAFEGNPSFRGQDPVPQIEAIDQTSQNTSNQSPKLQNPVDERGLRVDNDGINESQIRSIQRSRDRQNALNNLNSISNQRNQVSTDQSGRPYNTQTSYTNGYTPGFNTSNLTGFNNNDPQYNFGQNGQGNLGLGQTSFGPNNYPGLNSGGYGYGPGSNFPGSNGGGGGGGGGCVPGGGAGGIGGFGGGANGQFINGGVNPGINGTGGFNGGVGGIGGLGQNTQIDNGY